MKLNKVYGVPNWQDADGSEWSSFLTSVHFAEAKVGWAVGADQILLTRDGGKTWVNQVSVSMKGHIPKRVFSIDQRTAWVLTISRREGRGCYRTLDGGEKWDAQKVPEMIHRNDVFFIDQDWGWIISDDGALPAAGPMIHTTRDGGRSWEAQGLEMKGYPRRLKFITRNKGLLIQHTTNENKSRTICNILISNNGGYDWAVLKSFDRSITDLHVVNEKIFFVVGNGGFIARTADGGANWRRTYTKQRSCLNTIELGELGRGIAAGDFGLILLTEDMGQHWTGYDWRHDLDNVIDVHFLEKDKFILATSRALFLASYT